MPFLRSMGDRREEAAAGSPTNSAARLTAAAATTETGPQGTAAEPSTASGTDASRGSSRTRITMTTETVTATTTENESDPATVTAATATTAVLIGNTVVGTQAREAASARASVAGSQRSMPRTATTCRTKNSRLDSEARLRRRELDYKLRQQEAEITRAEIRRDKERELARRRQESPDDDPDEVSNIAASERTQDWVKESSKRDADWPPQQSEWPPHSELRPSRQPEWQPPLPAEPRPPLQPTSRPPLQSEWRQSVQPPPLQLEWRPPRQETQPPLPREPQPPPLRDLQSPRNEWRRDDCDRCSIDTPSQRVQQGLFDKFADAMTRVIDRSERRPASELPTFRGDVEEWLTFRAAYNESAARLSDTDNIVRLRRSLQGVAREAVSSLLIGHPRPEAIIEALARRFGRPEVLVCAEIEKLKALPRVSDDANELCVFANKIANAVAAIEILQRPQYLYSPETIRKIVEKMSPILRSKWLDYRSERGVDEPELKLVSSFLNREADKGVPYASIDKFSVRVKPDRTDNRRPRRDHAYTMSRTLTCTLCQADHQLSKCEKFGKLAVDARWEIVRQRGSGIIICFQCLRAGHQCRACESKRCGIRGCKRQHHRLLHRVTRAEPTAPAKAAACEPSRDVIASAIESADPARPKHSCAYLKIAPVTLQGPNGHQETFALLDEGSTVTIIDNEMAAKLGLDGPVSPMWIQGVGGSEIRHQRSKQVTVGVRGRGKSSAFMTRGAHTVSNLKLAAQTVTEEMLRGCGHLKSLRDTLTYNNAEPTILIGQDNWDLIVSRSVRSGRRNQPVASRTRLGWVLHGCRTSAAKPMVYCITAGRCEMAEMFREYASLEALGVESRRPKEDPEAKAVAMLDNMSRRLPSGRFETGLLWKNENTEVPDSYGMAAKRLTNLEKKLDRDPELKLKYEASMDDLVRAGHAEIAPAAMGRRTWYLPHFCVINPAKEKIRVVYDAAARCRGTSLNDMLLPGPDFLQALPAVLMKFRQYPVAVSADIKEMFLQIRIRDEDRDALRFLWRGERRTGPPTEYRMTSVVFGANSSPCTALYIKNRNATDYAEEFPEAARAIQANHYMDDYLQSFRTSEEALRVSKQVHYVHRQAEFELRGWASNDATVKKQLACEAAEVRIGGSELEKTLGLLWDTETDNITFRWNKHNVEMDSLQTPTKRQALSAIMSVFDPLGLISPITTPAKRIFQDSWKFSTGWDEPLPLELLERWQQWLKQMASLASLRVPRCYECSAATSYELHTFVDASEEAYAAATYWRITSAGGVKIALAMAKSRVTPTKIVSIPRLELQAAVLGVRISKTVSAAHEFVAASRVYWSDSRTALTWIRAEPRAYKPFVAHRLAEIEDETQKDEWRWVPTAYNVADDATRSTPPQFNSEHRWYRGPGFLYDHPSTWPVEKEKPAEDTGEERHASEKVMVAVKSPQHLPDISRFSSWLRLVRATARVLQFVELCKTTKTTVAAIRKRTQRNVEADPAWGKAPRRVKPKRLTALTAAGKHVPLEARFVDEAVLLWVRASQAEAFGPTLTRLRSGTEPTPDDKLKDLSLYLDDREVIRVRSRIRNAAGLQADTAAPLVLCGKSPYTRLYIQHVHEALHHGGVEIVVNDLRQSLHLSKIRPTVKSVLHRCQRCRIARAKPAQPSTGDLPPARLAHHARPFTYTGVDYFGPLEVTVGRRHEKRYVALFTCLTSRAVHLEVVHSLSASSCVSALRRFIARRGAPAEIQSDNATCFRAADKELAEAASAALADTAASHRINWRFLPPAAPFMAGAWERMVRTVKTALRVTLHERYPSDETLATLLAEVEATVNSRPLTHVAVDPDEPPALTPNMLLLGPDNGAPSPGVFSKQDETARAHWRRAQRLADMFWSRWVREYLPLLQHRREPRSSGVAPKVGDLVVVCDANQPRNTWPRGRVTRVFPGPDKQVRVADIETSSAHILRRPTKKLAVLPVDIV